MNAAVTCSLTSCANSTKDPSGRCHHHRSSGPIGADLPAPPPPSAPIVLRPLDPDATMKQEVNPDTGEVTEEWRGASGKMHRVGGPAFIVRDAQGETLVELYYVEGSMHRVDGPAIIDYRNDLRDYAFSNTSVKSPAELAKRLRVVPGLMDTEFELCSYRELLAEGIAPDTITDAIEESIFTLPGIRAFAEGAPAEWVRSYEEGLAS